MIKEQSSPHWTVQQFTGGMYVYTRCSLCSRLFKVGQLIATVRGQGARVIVGGRWSKPPIGRIIARYCVTCIPFSEHAHLPREESPLDERLQFPQAHEDAPAE